MPRYLSVPSYLPPKPPVVSHVNEYEQVFYYSEAPGAEKTITYSEHDLYPFYTPNVGWQWYSRSEISTAIDAEGYDRDLANLLRIHFTGSQALMLGNAWVYYAVKTQKARNAAKKKKQDAARNRAARLQLIPGEGS